jgi:hypothetical protein
MTLKPWLQIVATGLVVAALTAAIMLVLKPITATSEVTDMTGQPVVVDDLPSAATTSEMDVEPDTGGAFLVSSVGLDVPLGALNAVDGIITPPGFASAYVVRNLGVSLAKADTGTVYVVMHSIRGGGTAPGNYLFDIKQGAVLVDAGDTIQVDKARYRVTSTSLFPKSSLPSQESVWSNDPGRLVVITCMQHADGGPSTDNLVIFAQLIEPA